MNARKLTAALLLLIVPAFTWAQEDDIYFVPKKKAAKTEQVPASARRYKDVEIIYTDDTDDADISGISGSRRDVDEYNRRGPRSRSYQLPGDDTLYVLTDSTAITTRRMANDIYSQGYDEGYADGEDYAISRRLGRFGYGSVYASPWYYSYYDPFYYDYYDPWWGWGGYHVGYYGWHRPYWGYTWGWGYDPYWYGGYYGWHRPYYYGGYYGRGYRGGRSYGWRGNNRQPGYTGRSGGSYYRGGRSGNYSHGGRSSYGTRGGQVTTRGTGRSGGGNVIQGNATGRSNSSYGRSAGSTSSSRSYTPSTSTSRSSSSRSYTPSTSTSRSGGSFGGGSFGGSSGRSGGGGFSGGGGGGGRSGGRGGR